MPTSKKAKAKAESTPAPKRKRAPAKKATTPKQPRGRPRMSQDKLDTVLERMSNGETISQICREDGMPHRMTLYRHARADAEFSDKLARAREDQAEVWVDEMLEVAKDGSNDWIEDDDGNRKLNGEHVQRSKLVVDTLKWIVAVNNAKRFGPKVKVEAEHSVDFSDITAARHRARAVTKRDDDSA